MKKLYRIPEAAVTDGHNLDGLKQQKSTLSALVASVQIH